MTLQPPPPVQFGQVRVHLGLRNGKYPEANQMIIHGRDMRLAVEAPLGSARIGADFDRADLVVLSHVHEDHLAGLARVPQTPVHVPLADLPALQSWEGYRTAAGYAPAEYEHARAEIERDFLYAPRPDALGYADGAVWDLGGTSLRAVHLPGHTLGHSALVVDQEGLAFIGDIDLSSFGPYYGDTGSSLEQTRQSIKAVRDIPARIWVTGHHRGIYTDRAKFLADLDAYDATIDKRHAKLLRMLQEQPRTLEQLVVDRLIYPPAHRMPGVDQFERRCIVLHLDSLAAQGDVQQDRDTGIWSCC